MALSDNVIALVHDLSSAGLAVTLIDATRLTTEDSKSSIPSQCNGPTRHEPGASKRSQDVNKRKRSVGHMSEDIRPTRDREVLQNKLDQRIDVRYLNEIKSFKDKIRSSYLVACNEYKCPMIQERLTQHQIDHHYKYQRADNASSTKVRSRDQAINVSPTLSRMRLPKFTLPLRVDDGQHVQTDITMRDFSPNRLFIRRPVDIDSRDGIPLRKSETREVLPKRNFYKEHLQNEILNWLQTVPLFYSLNFTNKDIKDNIVNNLAENINNLAVEAQDENYETKTKIEIDNCLSKLPMWLHGTREDQVLFKDGLKENLWLKIQELNEKFLGIKYEKPKIIITHENVRETAESNDSYEKEVIDWSRQLELKDEIFFSRQQVVDLIMKRLSPLLKIPLHTTSYKLILKGQIIDILDDLPLTLTTAKFRTVHLNRIAEELANRLLSVQLKRKLSVPKLVTKETTILHTGQITTLPSYKSRTNLKMIILDKIGECLDKVPICHRNDLKTEICSSFIDSNENLRSDDVSIENEICTFLRDTGKISGDETQTVATMIIKQVTDAIKDARNTTATSFDYVMPSLSGTLSVYRWGSGNPAATSTPKKPSKKDIPKLNPEETAYIKKIGDAIRKWMDTLPKQFNENKNFKETMINDLAGDIMDHRKLEQISPGAFADKEKYQNYLIYKWLYKFNIFDDAKIKIDAKPHIENIVKDIEQIPVPNLIAPHHGTRQAMGNIKHMEGEYGWDDDYVPRGIDVLEDQISVWMNEQPTEIYSTKDKDKRDKLVHDLALTLQDHLRNKSPETVIEKDIDQWLKKVVKSKEKEHIGLLKQDLKEKVINIPQDQTLEARHQERKRYIAAKTAAKRQMKAQVGQPSTQPAQDVSNFGNVTGDPDRTIREFIAKFIKHNYDIDDPMALGAFSHLLKTELRKLAPVTRKEVYDHFEQSKPHEKFNPENLNNELQYIKIISDWLNNIPIDPSYNTPGNKDRIDFINDLARNVQELEEQRIQNPEALEYNYLTASMILESMHSYGLPILPEHKDNTPLMVEQLLQKLVDLRPGTSSIKYESQSPSPNQPSISQSLDASDIKEQNLSDFITDYIRVNGKDIADDPVKLDAWTARLMKEVKKMLHEGADPHTLCKAEVYEKFSKVPIPTAESLKRFSSQIGYVKEITDWMKNIPLLPIESDEKMSEMISELSEKMWDTQAKNLANPNDNIANENLEAYIASWISRLPLDKRKEINQPILIKQLMNRLGNFNQNVGESYNEEELPMVGDVSTSPSYSSSEKQGKEKQKGQQVPESSSTDKRYLKFFKNKKSPAEIIVEAIEKWSNSLPIKLNDKEAVKSMKEEIARKLYQKTGELNVDPRIFNDDLLYRDILGDEIDTQLENIPQNSELQKNRENLREGLLNTIVETNKIIKENSIGENYRHKLEATLDASIPNPVQSQQVFDPGFDIYKNHLADIFILENFDHANDELKASYEKRIRREVDKYFESAQNKNALPLSKDQIYNELYSALFKVPMPTENSLIDEVEIVKTRCEVDAWYEDLPVRETDNINDLLEQDKILSTLAKRIHDIEKYDNSDKKIHNEIRKWLEKLPLLPGNEGIDTYILKLKNQLKSSLANRKHVPYDPNASKGKKIVNNKQQKDRKPPLKDGNTSEVPGPSNALKSKSTNAKPCLQVPPMTHRKPGDIIVEIVDEWCNQLPLISTEENNKLIKDNISTRIIIQISELNMDTEIFNDDVVYDELLDEELEKVMSNLPVCCDFAESKPARKYQLIEMIKSIKPLIKDEKERQEYKEELNNTVCNLLKEPHEITQDKLALFNKLKDEIVENFVQYSYNKNDDEGRQLYKNQIHDAVIKYCIEIRDKGTGEDVDPLVRRNQLLCELEKIPVQQAALKEEVDEIKMKKEIKQFFLDQSIPEGEAEDKMKKHLTKRLCEIETSGYNAETEKKLNSEIDRCLKKLNKNVSPEIIENFVNKLKNNETERNKLPITSSDAANLNQSRLPGSPRPIGYRTSPFTLQAYQQTPQQQDTIGNVPESRNVEELVSLLPATPQSTSDSGYHTPYVKEIRPEVQGHSLRRARMPQQVDESFGDSTVHYDKFQSGNFLSSSAAPQSYAQSQFPGQPFAGYSSVSRDNRQPSESQKSMYKSYQQNQGSNMRKILSGSSYGQIATPRQVAQTPYMQYSPKQNVTTPGNATPDPLFQVPEFRPLPFHRPLPVPILGPGFKYGSRRSVKGPENTLVPSSRGMRLGGPIAPTRKPRGFETDDEEEIICRCDRCTRRTCRGMPFCMLTMEEYFEDCFGFPMWCGVRFPECLYY